MNPFASGQKAESPELESVLVRLMVPKNNEKTPIAAELLFAALHGTFNYSSSYQPVMSFEIVSINNFIQFYFYAPRYLKEFIEGQFYAQYPTVEAFEAEDYASKVVHGKHAIGFDVATTKEDVYPIKTFENFDVDPLSGITSVLSQLDGEDEMWIQICVSPIDDSWQKRAINYVDALRAGRNPNEPLWKSLLKGMVGAVGDAAKSPTEGAKQNSPAAADLSTPVQTALKGIEDKTTKLGYQTKIRVVSLSSNVIKARQKLNAIMGAFKQFNQPNLNSFIQGMEIEGETILASYRKRSLGTKPYILNISEIASIYHLPGESVATPAMDWAGSRKGEPPQNLPLIEDNGTEDMSILGKTNFRNVERKFGIRIKDRALHMYAIGKTGTGKSTLLGNMIIDDIAKGRGVAVVDPHGDLINDIMEYIPESRMNDVVYISPADRDFPVGFNLLESVNPEYKNIVASGIVGVFKKIFGESWGPRLEYILRNVVLGLLDYPNATMLSIIKVLTDTKYRREVVAKITDPVIRDFFINEYERYDQKFRTEAVAPIQNKVGQFLSSTIIRNIVGQEKSSVDLRALMDSKKIVLIDLSIGKIGEDNSALLGSMLITKIQMAAMTRADLSKEERIPFYLYVDEFQNFATDSFAVILSEARKYGLSLTVTNQYVAQMPETVSDAIFGNVGTIICFRVGAGDADNLQREFLPVFEATDLVNLDNHNIYVKMAINGVTSTPFSAKTMLSDYPKTNFVPQIIEQSRIKYSRPREEVEKMISDSSSSANMTVPLSNPLNSVKPKVASEATVEDNTAPASDPYPYPADEQEEERPKRKADMTGIVSEGTDLPEELANVKTAEDYDTNKWYFLNRTDFRNVTNRNEDGTFKKNSVGVEEKEAEDK